MLFATAKSYIKYLFTPTLAWDVHILLITSKKIPRLRGKVKNKGTENNLNAITV